MRNKSLTLLGLLVLVWAWLAYDHYRPWVNFHSEALALLALFLLATDLVWRKPQGERGAPRLISAVLLLALLPWLQWGSGIVYFAGDALMVWLHLSALALAIWVGWRYERQVVSGETGGAEDVAGVFYVIWVAALVSAAIGLLQWLNLQEPLGMHVVQTEVGDRAMGNLGQPNQLATLLLMGMAALVWTFERRRIGVLSLVLGVAFMTWVLVLTQSRTGLLSGFVVVMVMVFKSKSLGTRISAKYWVGWYLVYLLAVQLLPLVNEALLMGGGSRDLAANGVGVDAGRFGIWRQIWEAIAQAPWLGYGWNQTSAAHMVGSLTVPGQEPQAYAHNLVIDLLVWNGVPLGLLITGGGAYWFLSRLRAAKESSAVYAMLMLLCIAVHSMLEYPFAYAYFLVTAGLLAGIVEARHPLAATTRLAQNGLRAGIVASAVLGCLLVREYVLIEADFQVVRFERLRVGQTPAEYEAPEIFFLSHMGELLKVMRQPVQRGMSREELENLKHVAQRFPFASVTLQNVIVLGINDDVAGAKRQLVILHHVYGDDYYRSAVARIRELQADKYPELAHVLAL